MTAPAGSPESSPLQVALGLVRSARPRQWVKNVLVAAAPAAGGVLLEPRVLRGVGLAFVAFTLAAAGTYLLNDVRDRAADSLHPSKQDRPIASGLVPVPAAVVVAVVALVAGIVLPLLAGAPGLAGIVLAYVAMTTLYSLGLKHVAIIELAIVAAGFVLRAVAGAVAADVPVSHWFLIVVSAGALHLVATKRFAEARDREVVAQRRVLADYVGDSLAEIRFASVAVALTGYLLWAFDPGGGDGSLWFALSSVPFALALFRYGAAVHEGAGEAPELVLLRDRQMLAYEVTWACVFLVGVYDGGP